MARAIITINNGISLTINRHPSGNILPGENVQFWVSDVTGYSGTDEHRDISIEWDFDDTGATYGVGGGGADNDANKEYDRVVCKAWDTTGAKTVTAFIRIHGQDVPAEVTIDIPVVALDTITWEEEWYVSFANDFTEAPEPTSSIIRISSYADLVARSVSSSAVNYKVLFNRGETFNWAGTGDLAFRYSDIVFIGGFGTGASPVIQPDSSLTRSDSATLVKNIWGENTNGHRLIISDLTINSSYDPSTGDAPDGTLSLLQMADPTIAQPLAVSVYKCDLSGCALPILINGSNQGTTVYLSVTDTTISNWFDYGVASLGALTSFAMHGCSVKQHPRALTLNDGKATPLPDAADHGPCRIGVALRYGISNNTLASTNGWSGPIFQPCLRLYTEQQTDQGFTTPYTFETLVGHVSRNRTYGAMFAAFGNSTPGSNRPTEQFPPYRVRVWGNEHVETAHKFGSFIQIQVPGFYIFSNINYASNVAQSTNSPNLVNAALIDGEHLFLPETFTSPLWIENNTYVSDVSVTGTNATNAVDVFDRSAWDSDVLYDFATYSENEVRNNIIEAPNHAGTYTDYSPLDPTNNWRPAAASAAIDAVTGITPPVLDFNATVNGGTINEGAVNSESVAAGTVSAPSYDGTGLTISELSAFPGVYHLSSFGNWTNWDGDDRYLWEFDWQVDGVSQGVTNNNTFDSTGVTGDLTMVVTVTNRSGARESATSNTITLV